ncbi:MAG: hypothetical protein EAX87_10360 [Candidatus Thorarchaeota archaeon]|nr:hypothetical protein [Candidatus Thorarchaeota archaeon]
MTMENKCISKADILRSTLFQIQIKQCQYIDNFPEAVTSVFDNAAGKKKLKKYSEIKQKLYRIKTNFFAINKGKVKKKIFFEELYERIRNRAR